MKNRNLWISSWVFAVAMIAMSAMIGSSAAKATVVSAPRQTYFEEAARAMALQGDRDGASMLRHLGSGSPTVPPVLSRDAVRANSDYAAKYTELRSRLRQAILRPAHSPDVQWRVDKTEADLHLVARELEKGSRASRDLVQRFLADANWALDHQIVPLNVGAEEVPVAAAVVPAPTANISADPSRIDAGASSVVAWNTTNATHATVNNRNVALNGNMTVTPGSTTNYNLVATGEGGRAEDAATVTVVVPPPPATPSANISANPERIQLGQSSTLTWSTSNAAMAKINGDNVPLNGSRSVSPDATTAYDLVATGPGGRAMDSAKVTVFTVPPTAEISVRPNTVERGQCATLAWNSSNATSVTINGRREDLSGARQVCPTASESYDMVATGPGGRAPASATLTVFAPAAPTANLSAYPNEIERGQCTILRWETSNASDATLDGDKVLLNGTKEVCPTTTTTYNLVAKGPGGRADDSERITVKVPVVVVPAARAHYMIHFDFDEAVIRPDAIDTMAAVASRMRANPEMNMKLEGHCDAIGSDAYNMELGMRRAASVRDFFVSRYGINPTRFDLVSKGEREPLAPNSTSGSDDPGHAGSRRDNPAGRAMNRRAEFIEIQ